jgi:hypothetical protein
MTRIFSTHRKPRSAAEQVGHDDDSDVCQAILSPLVRESKVGEVALAASFNAT